ncbi:MAG: hypothetical protein HKN49_03180 [Gammaproteobacteria bacterium]|nr:hypothetical protein [Gammaproteobacteria bacterium]
MSAITVYCCGSGNTREDSKWLVPTLWARDVRINNKLILDGPGTTHKLGKTSLEKAKNGHQIKLRERSGAGKKQYEITGAPAKGNTSYAATWIGSHLNKEQCLISQVNLIGFSRGGATTIQIAHMLSWFLKNKDIDLNIFTFDPVPGGSNFDKSGFGKKSAGGFHLLSTCVSNYQTIPMLNIKKYLVKVLVKKDKSFPCTIPMALSKKTNYKIIPLPGHHGDACRATPGPGLQANTSTIGHFLAQKFLEEHGVQFSKKGPTEKDALEAYARIRMLYMPGGEHTVSRNREFVSTILKKRMMNLPVNVDERDFYVNDHHYELMKNANLCQRLTDTRVHNTVAHLPAYPRTQKALSAWLNART